MILAQNFSAKKKNFWEKWDFHSSHSKNFYQKINWFSNICLKKRLYKERKKKVQMMDNLVYKLCQKAEVDLQPQPRFKSLSGQLPKAKTKIVQTKKAFTLQI